MATQKGAHQPYNFIASVVKAALTKTPHKINRPIFDFPTSGTKASTPFRSEPPLNHPRQKPPLVHSLSPPGNESLSQWGWIVKGVRADGRVWVTVSRRVGAMFTDDFPPRK